MELSPGGLYWARPDGTVGREQAGRRPVLIVCGEQYLEVITTLALAVPLTTTDRGWPNHVLIRGATRLSHPSFAMSEQVRAVSRDRLTGTLGQVDAACLHEVRRWLTDYLHAD